MGISYKIKSVQSKKKHKKHGETCTGGRKMNFFKDFKNDLKDDLKNDLKDDFSQQASVTPKMQETIDKIESLKRDLERKEALQQVFEESKEEQKEDMDTVKMAEKLVEAKKIELGRKTRPLEQEEPVLAAMDLNKKREEKKVTSIFSKKETIVITSGTVINGNLETDAAIELNGSLNGDVNCSSKVVITGAFKGNLKAEEASIEGKKLEGDIQCNGKIYIKKDCVVIGNIKAKAAVIEGAIKGQLDVNGPVIVDASATIKGNINAKTVQINDGALIDGFCSLTYSEITAEKVFENFA